MSRPIHVHTSLQLFTQILGLLLITAIASPTRAASLPERPYQPLEMAQKIAEACAQAGLDTLAGQ